MFSIFLLAAMVTVGSAQERNIIGTKKGGTVLRAETPSSSPSTAELAQLITLNASTESGKVHAIYRWIVNSIRYDHALRTSKRLQDKIYTSEENVVKNVLLRKKALCGGYAFLFRDLCRSVGITAEAIHGFTKDFSGVKKEYDNPHHTWNAVRIDGKWKLLDIAWAVGYGSDGVPDDFWFLLPPEEFIYSHYPQDVKWTLMQDPISFSAFQNVGFKE